MSTDNTTNSHEAYEQALISLKTNLCEQTQSFESLGQSFEKLAKQLSDLAAQICDTEWKENSDVEE